MTVVVKVGGALIDSEPARQTLMRYLKPLRALEPVVLVHGGGAQATQLARRMGHTPRMINGRRVTTDLDLDIHLWVTLGELNARMLGAAFAAGIQAVGLNGASAGLLEVTRRPPRMINDEEVDFGWVGDVSRVNGAICQTLLDAGVLPVIAPLGVDRRGLLYNVNADSVAAQIALALGASRLLFVAEAGALRRRADVNAERIHQVDRALFEQGRAAGWIVDGMQVKLENAFTARADGVAEVYICAPADLSDPTRGTQVL